VVSSKKVLSNTESKSANEKKSIVPGRIS
jgi:hypothetical protein